MKPNKWRQLISSRKRKTWNYERNFTCCTWTRKPVKTLTRQKSFLSKNLLSNSTSTVNLRQKMCCSAISEEIDVLFQSIDLPEIRSWTFSCESSQIPPSATNFPDKISGEWSCLCWLTISRLSRNLLRYLLVCFW